MKNLEKKSFIQLSNCTINQAQQLKIKGGTDDVDIIVEEVVDI